MNSKKIFALLLLVITTISCKDEAKKDDNGQQNQEVATPDNTFKVSLNVVVKKNDNFCLLYTEDGSTNFKEGIWKEVKAAENGQIVEFSLPKDIIPSQLRLDLGMNKDQEPIVINSFQMNYSNNEFKIPGNQFWIYFNPDLTKTAFDKNTATVSGLVKDGVRQSPSFYPNTTPLGNEIRKIIK